VCPAVVNAGGRDLEEFVAEDEIMHAVIPDGLQSEDAVVVEIVNGDEGARPALGERDAGAASVEPRDAEGLDGAREMDGRAIAQIFRGELREGVAEGAELVGRGGAGADDGAKLLFRREGGDDGRGLQQVIRGCRNEKDDNENGEQSDHRDGIVRSGNRCEPAIRRGGWRYGKVASRPEWPRQAP